MWTRSIEVNWLNNMLGAAFLISGVFIIAASYIRQFANFKNRHKENVSWSSPVPFVGPCIRHYRFPYVATSTIKLDIYCNHPWPGYCNYYYQSSLVNKGVAWLTGYLHQTNHQRSFTKIFYDLTDFIIWSKYFGYNGGEL